MKFCSFVFSDSCRPTDVRTRVQIVDNENTYFMCLCVDYILNSPEHRILCYCDVKHLKQ